MVFFVSLFDWNRFSGNLSFTGFKSDDNSGSNLGTSGIWNSNGSPAMVMAVSKYRNWIFGFEITK